MDIRGGKPLQIEVNLKLKGFRRLQALLVLALPVRHSVGESDRGVEKKISENTKKRVVGEGGVGRQ